MRQFRSLNPVFAAVFLAGAVSGYSQGQVWWGDYSNSDFQITIWSWQESGPGYLTGNSPANFGTGLTPTGPDIPAGTQTGYTGVPLGGSSTGVVSLTDFANGNLWSVQLYAGPLGSALTAVPGAVANMSTEGNQGLYNVMGNAYVTIPGVAAGSPAQLQLKAWYNGGGTITSYEAAVFESFPTGQSAIGIETLGGGDQAPDLPGPGNPGVIGGITSFSLVALVEEIHIWTQPANQEVFPGASATFSVTAFGDFPASGYQWLFNNLYISGATNSSYTVINAQPANAGNYSVIVTSANVSVTSAAATLTITAPVAPTATLIDVAFTDDSVTDKTGFAAIGLSASDFWNTFDVSSTLSLPNLEFVNLTASGVGLAIKSPVSGAAQDGASDPMYGTYVYAYNISVVVSNLPTGAYDFYLYGHGNGDIQNSVFRLTAGSKNYGQEATINGSGWLSSAWQEGVQYVEFTNVNISAGQIITITVEPGEAPNLAALSGLQITDSGLFPYIATPPANQDIFVGAGATFNVVADGLPPLSYQWLFNNADIFGATNSSYSVINAQAPDAGNYAVIVTNYYGVVMSQPATLTVAASNQVEISIGSSTALAGQGTCVPVSLMTAVPLTNLNFALASQAGFLTNWNISSTNSAIAAATVAEGDASLPHFSFSVQSGQALQGSSVIGSICLDTLAGPSAFVPLVVTNILAMGSNNSLATNLLSQKGRVVVIGPQPLLEGNLDTNWNLALTLYGHPGTAYNLLAAPNLIDGGSWSLAGNVTLNDLFQVISLGGVTNQMQFYKAVLP